MINFSKLIKDKRKDKGLTLSYLEELTGISSSYISRIENEINKTPSLEHGLKLSHALDIPIEQLKACYGIVNNNSMNTINQKDNLLIKMAESELKTIASNDSDYKKSLEKIISICEELRKNIISIVVEKDGLSYIVKMKLYDENLIDIISKLLKEQYLIKNVLVIQGEVMSRNKKEFSVEEFLQGANEYFGVLEDDEYAEIKGYLSSIGY